MNIKRFGLTLALFGLIGLVFSALWQEGTFFEDERREIISLRADAAMHRIKVGRMDMPSMEQEDIRADAIERRIAQRSADGKTGVWVFGLLLLVGIAVVFGLDASSDRKRG